MLQKLLNLRLIEISDDGQFEKLQKTSNMLADRLVKTPSEAIPAILVGLDQEIDSDEPTLEMVEQELLKEWKTFRNRFPDRPRQILRYLLLDAGWQAGGKSWQVAAGIWLAAANIFHHCHLGKETAPIQEMLETCAQVYEEKALAALNKPFAKSNLQGLPKINAPQIAIPTIDFQKVEGLVGASVGPQVSSARPYEGANPQWPHPQQLQQWANNFTPRMAKALVDTVTEAISQLALNQGTALKSIQDSLQKVLDAHEKYLQTLTQSMQSFHRVEQQVGTLWWSEALYSPSLRTSYRDFERPVAAVLMAFDLQEIVGTLAPASVSHLLFETVHQLSDASCQKSLELGVFLQILKEHGEPLRAIVKQAGKVTGRELLSNTIARAIHGESLDDTQIRKLVGLSHDTSFTIPDFAVAVFRNIQALNVVNQPS